MARASHLITNFHFKTAFKWDLMHSLSVEGGKKSQGSFNMSAQKRFYTCFISGGKEGLEEKRSLDWTIHFLPILLAWHYVISCYCALKKSHWPVPLLAESGGELWAKWFWGYLRAWKFNPKPSTLRFLSDKWRGLVEQLNNVLPQIPPLSY